MFKVYDELEFYPLATRDDEGHIVYNRSHYEVPVVMLVALELDITEAVPQQLYDEFIGAFDNTKECISYMLEAYGFEVFIEDATRLVKYYNELADELLALDEAVNLDDDDAVVAYIIKAGLYDELVADISERVVDSCSELTWYHNALTGNNCYFWC